MMTKFQKGYWRKFGFLSTGLILLTGLVYGGLINNLNLWTDEIYSVLMAKDSFSDMWFLLTTEDSEPPLYYLYLKGILMLFPKKYEIFAAHFSSYIFLIISQIFAATAVRKDYGNDVSLWFIVVVALMPQSLWLAFEVRTYMLSSFLMFVALIFGLRLLKEPKGRDFFLFGFVSVLALYSHY